MIMSVVTEMYAVILNKEFCPLWKVTSLLYCLISGLYNDNQFFDVKGGRGRQQVLPKCWQIPPADSGILIYGCKNLKTEIQNAWNRLWVKRNIWSSFLLFIEIHLSAHLTRIGEKH